LNQRRHTVSRARNAAVPQNPGQPRRNHAWEPFIGEKCRLGAGRTSVLGLILGEGAKVAAIGVLLGLLLAFGLAKAMAGFLFEVQVFDPLIVLGATVFLALAAMLACYVPARRASNVDPMTILRQQ